MQKLGYGPDHRLPIKVTTRDWSIYRDPAVLLIDQLKQVYIDGEPEIIDTAQYFPKIQRKDFSVALNFQTAGPDPDPIVHLFYGCGSGLNWDGYCNEEVDKMIEQQSREANSDHRRQLLWTIERKLAEDNARPIIYYRPGGTCVQPYVKGLTIDVNYIFGSWRMEDVWLDNNQIPHQGPGNGPSDSEQDVDGDDALSGGVGNSGVIPRRRGCGRASRGAKSRRDS
jgi:peptide/nickel transport system substrate-binding protein